MLAPWEVPNKSPPPGKTLVQKPQGGGKLLVQTPGGARGGGYV